MAARLRSSHQDEVRAKIQASQLINVLQNHALGKDEKEITNSRLKAIEILLKKSMPDLSSVDMSGGLAITTLPPEKRKERLKELTKKLNVADK